MSFWWVSQNKTFKEEKYGGYLWAPMKNASGKSMFHWETMNDVRQGDIIFSYYDQKILAYSTAQGEAYDSVNPFNESGDDWELNGRRIDVTYTVLRKPILVRKIAPELQELLQKQTTHKPLNVNGTGNQGYLFPLIDDAGDFLLSICERASSR